MLPLLKAASMAGKQNPPKPGPSTGIGSKAVNVLVVTGAGIGTFLLVRGIARKIIKGLREKSAIRPGDPASYAMRLKMAFENDNWFGWGTNEGLVYEILEEIPDGSVMRKAQNAYRDLYNTNLMADLSSELDTTEFARALAIINSKS